MTDLEGPRAPSSSTCFLQGWDLVRTVVPDYLENPMTIVDVAVTLEKKTLHWSHRMGPFGFFWRCWRQAWITHGGWVWTRVDHLPLFPWPNSVWHIRKRRQSDLMADVQLLFGDSWKLQAILLQADKIIPITRKYHRAREIRAGNPEELFPRSRPRPLFFSSSAASGEKETYFSSAPWRNFIIWIIRLEVHYPQWDAMLTLNLQEAFRINQRNFTNDFLFLTFSKSAQLPSRYSMSRTFMTIFGNKNQSFGNRINKTIALVSGQGTSRHSSTVNISRCEIYTAKVACRKGWHPNQSPMSNIGHGGHVKTRLNPLVFSPDTSGVRMIFSNVFYF